MLKHQQRVPETCSVAVKLPFSTCERRTVAGNAEPQAAASILQHYGCLHYIVQRKESAPATGYIPLLHILHRKHDPAAQNSILQHWY